MQLPPALEHLRQTFVATAAHGVPAHVTLLYPFVLYPFVGPSELDPSIRRRIALVAARHAPFDYKMTGPERWPDSIYVAVEPIEPFVRLQADLAATFPDYPIYGEGSDVEYTPHITVAEGRAVEREHTVRNAAWSALPITARAAWLDVIATSGARWSLVWRMPLGGG